RARGAAADRARLPLQGDRRPPAPLDQDGRGARVERASQAAALLTPRALALGTATPTRLGMPQTPLSLAGRAVTERTTLDCVRWDLELHCAAEAGPMEHHHPLDTSPREPLIPSRSCKVRAPSARPAPRGARPNRPGRRRAAAARPDLPAGDRRRLPRRRCGDGRDLPPPRVRRPASRAASAPARPRAVARGICGRLAPDPPRVA